MVCPRVWCCFVICLQKVCKSTKDFDLQITWPELELSTTEQFRNTGIERIMLHYVSSVSA